jgi:hypothetical protein
MRSNCARKVTLVLGQERRPAASGGVDLRRHARQRRLALELLAASRT